MAPPPPWGPLPGEEMGVAVRGWASRASWLWCCLCPRSALGWPPRSGACGPPSAVLMGPRQPRVRIHAAFSSIQPAAAQGRLCPSQVERGPSRAALPGLTLPNLPLQKQTRKSAWKALERSGYLERVCEGASAHHKPTFPLAAGSRFLGDMSTGPPHGPRGICVSDRSRWAYPDLQNLVN